MDTDTFFNRIRRRVAELEASGKRIPADIKKTIRQRPQHGYRLDSLERLAEALDWSVPELLAGIWQSAKFSQDAVPYGLRRHAVCLAFALRTRLVNQLMPLTADQEERQLENRVAELYQQWLEFEKASRQSINAETMTVYWEQIERRAVEIVEERRGAEASPGASQQTHDPSAPELKAASDAPEHPLAA